MTNKEKYQALCKQVEMPIFQQYWWLEGASAGKDWDVLLFYGEGDEHDRIIAALPYEMEHHLWRLFIHPAELTPYGGLWVADDIKTSPERLEALCLRLDAELKQMKVVGYRQYYSPENIVPKGLLALGYADIQRQTWVLDTTQNVEVLLGGFSKNKRRKMEKTAGLYTVCDIEPEEFYRFCQLTSLQKKRKMLYTRELLLVLWEKASENRQARMIGIRDAEGVLLAASLLVWDQHMAYQLVNTFDHDTPDNGARELLTLEAIKQAHQLGLRLDFVNPREYLKHYGATKQTYQVAVRASRTYVVLLRIVNWWQHL